jgi:hypothetical protein
MGEAARLYEEDYLAWTREQVKALRGLARDGSNLPLDLENLAEEIEDLGKSEREELFSRVETVLDHLLKLQFAPVAEPRAGWRGTILRSRQMISRRLERSPSLRRELPEIIADAHRTARKVVLLDLEDRGELDSTSRQALERAQYSEAEILGDWFPPPPSA